MLIRVIMISIMALLLASCGGEGGERLPTKPFSENYGKADFDLREDVEYWELRRGPLLGKDLSGFSIIQSFGNLDALDDVQQEMLQAAVSQAGFDAECLPDFCPKYAVAVNGYGVMIIDSPDGLAEFFGTINTEAELYFYLSNTSYAPRSAPDAKPLSYEEVPEGYQVVLEWDTFCQLRGKDFVLVHKDGTVEQVREISIESYNMCV